MTIDRAAPRADEAGREGARIAVLLHALDDQRTDGSDRSRPRAADGTPEQAHPPCRPPPCRPAARRSARGKKRIMRSAIPKCPHQRACQDEEGNGQQRIAGRRPWPIRSPARSRPKPDLPHGRRARRARARGDGNAQEDQQEKEQHHLGAGADVRHWRPLGRRPAGWNSSAYSR